MNAPLIAIVNDTPQIVRLLETILHEAGYHTISYRQGAGAVDLLRATTPALLMLNIRMEHPRAGWQVLDELRCDRTLQRLPVLIHSAYVHIEAQVQARADPYCAVLPFFLDHATLPAVITEMLQR